MNSRTLFLLLNVIGGMAVLGSYAWGIGLFPELREAFWGGVPEGLRGVYSINMIFAAAGYIAAFLYFMIKLGSDEFGRLYWCYLLVLLFSALWLPLTVAFLTYQEDWIWRFIRVDLLAVALGGILMIKHVWKTENAGTGLKAAITFGLFFFSLQTLVLDGFVWPYYFELPVK